MAANRAALREVAEVIDGYSGRSRTVLEYCRVLKCLVDRAKQPGFTVESWVPLAELVAVEDFERVGNFKETMRWHDYADFLTKWATSSYWECSFKRITETPDLVILELEERNAPGDHEGAVNSISVYEFDEAGKIRRVELYLQMALPGSRTFENHEGGPIAG